jgi:hypothetical protein
MPLDTIVRMLIKLPELLILMFAFVSSPYGDCSPQRRRESLFPLKFFLTRVHSDLCFCLDSGYRDRILVSVIGLDLSVKLEYISESQRGEIAEQQQGPNRKSVWGGQESVQVLRQFFSAIHSHRLFFHDAKTRLFIIRVFA